MYFYCEIFVSNLSGCDWRVLSLWFFLPFIEMKLSMMDRNLFFISERVLNFFLRFLYLLFALIYLSNQENGLWFLRLINLFHFFYLRLPSKLLWLFTLMFPHFSKEIIETLLIFIILADRIDTFQLEDLASFIRIGVLGGGVIEMFIFVLSVWVIWFFFEDVKTALDSHVFLVFIAVCVILLRRCICDAKIGRSVDNLTIISFLSGDKCWRWMRHITRCQFWLLKLFKWKASASVIIGHLIKLITFIIVNKLCYWIDSILFREQTKNMDK